MTTVKALTRQQNIVAFVREFGEVSVEQIEEAFKISQPTVHRDLNALHQQGLISKTRGKIVVQNQPKRIEDEFDGDDYIDRFDVIDRIGRAACETVGENEIVFIGPGTIAFSAARYIAEKPGMVLQTCSLRHASLLRNSRASTIWVVGGKIDPRTGYITGGFALDVMRHFHSDTVIIGCTGIDPRLGVLLPSSDLALLLKEALLNGHKRILVADSSRFTGAKSGIVLPFEYIDEVITDKDVDPTMIGELERCGVKVRLV